ncbi:MAG: Transcriptional regulator, PaaX family [Marmoricola sp.]|nr:Transcriptional regulator, PaaX family [Marmoricola sp.]
MPTQSTALASGSALLRPDGAPLAPGSARSLLVTILGELVWPTRSPVRTSTLVHILGGLGVEEHTARQALARAASSDWIVPVRQGREVSWSLSDKLVRIFDEGSQRVYSLSDPFTGWDGTWLALWATVPQSHRATRRPLYAGLTWAGLGNPTPGLWLSPHVERAAEVKSLVEGLGLSEHTLCLTGTLSGIGLTETEIVARGWDLDALREHYEQVLAAVTDLDPQGPHDTLLTHVRMLSEYQELPRTDPQLPEVLLPDWIGRRVARRIEGLRAQWAPTTHAHFAALDTTATS